MTSGDIDGDSDIDLFVTDRSNDSWTCYLNDGTGTFTAGVTIETGSVPSDIEVVDLTGDSLPEVVISHQFDDDFSVYRNLGACNFLRLGFRTEVGAPSFATSDFNGDGITDIAIASSVGYSIHIGKGNGIFGDADTNPVGSVFDLKASDINGDGFSDLILSRSNATVLVYLNDQQGSFVFSGEFVISQSVESIVLADPDGDGLSDFIVGFKDSSQTRYFTNAGDGTFAVADSMRNFYIASTDGILDGYSVNFDNKNGDDLLLLFNNGFTLLPNRGDGTYYVDEISTLGFGVLLERLNAADINGDQITDYVVASGSIRIATGNAAGMFDPVSLPGPNGNDCLLGDVTGDGVLDIVGVGNDLFVFPGLGAGDFDSPVTIDTSSEAEKMDLGDIDLDGDLDAVATYPDSDQVIVFLNDGSGTQFTQIVLDVDSPDAIRLGDVESDGDLDIIVTLLNHEIQVWTNDGTGNFEFGSAYYGGENAEYLFVEHLDGDSHLDFVTSNVFEGQFLVLRNTCNQLVTLKPASFILVRGIPVEGTIADLSASDDQYVRAEPGFTLSSSEPPVWMEATFPLAGEETALAVQTETQISTPGISRMTQAFNFFTNEFDTLAIDSASFGQDEVKVVPIPASDYVDFANGTTSIRIGWKQSGFVLMFPWTASIDQFALGYR